MSDDGARAVLPDDVKALLDGASDAAVLMDGERRLLHFNAAYQQVSGLGARTLAVAASNQKRCYEVLPLEICESACLGRRAACAGKALRVDDIRAVRGDGEALTVIVTATPLPGGLVVESYRDVTAEARVQRRYKELLDLERRAKEILELTVQERTEALRAANEELKRTQAQLIHQEKMSSLGRLVAGIAHELNNPINFVYGNVDFLGRYLDDLLALVALYDECAADLPAEHRRRIDEKKNDIEFDFLTQDAAKLIRSIRSGAERTAGIVRDLKAFSRPGRGELQEVDLVAGIETTLNLIAPLLKNRVEVHREFEEPAPRVLCHPGHINQVFMNVLTNAAQAIRGEGHIYVKLERVSGRDEVRVTVRDTGPGIPAEIIGKVFDPFFSTKEVGEGTGLGLALSESIVRSHGGAITCESTTGQGATFIVTLPLRAPAEASAAGAAGSRSS